MEKAAPREALAPVLVAGVGNPHRSDDGAGIAVVEALRGRTPGGVELVEWLRSPMGLIDLWQGRDLAVVVDAVSSQSLPGGLHRFDVGTGPLPPEAFQVSTHSVGLAETVELARTLVRLPRHIIVFGVEGRDFGLSSGLTPAVLKQVPVAAERILEEITRWVHGVSLRRPRGSPCV